MSISQGSQRARTPGGGSKKNKDDYITERVGTRRNEKQNPSDKVGIWRSPTLWMRRGWRRHGAIDVCAAECA